MSNSFTGYFKKRGRHSSPRGISGISAVLKGIAMCESYKYQRHWKYPRGIFLRSSEWAFSWLNIPSENLSLAQEGIFLAFEEGVSVFYTGMYLRRAFLWPSNRSLCRASDIAGCPYQMQS
jgi:hypothetical protein